MEIKLKDPSIDVVHKAFLQGLSRFCLLLALGNFLCIAPLYFFYFYQPTNNLFFSQYITLLTVVGTLLTILGVLCRYESYRETVAKLCVAILFGQTTYVLYEVQSLDHPVSMLFAILCFIVTPILGRNSSYFLSFAEIIAVATLHHIFFLKTGGKNFMTLFLLSFGYVFSAHVSAILWKSVLKREQSLKTALSQLHQKSKDIDIWAKNLVRASASINEGSLTLSLPKPPPYQSFADLTHELEVMQEKLGKYFAQSLIQDKLNSLGILASGLAHELNTPLTSLTFLLESEESKLDPELKKAIKSELKRMSSITRDLLNFSSPHQENCVMDLNEVIRESLPVLKRIPSKSVTLRIDLCKEPLLVKGSRTQLEQVLLNLYRNSVDSLSDTVNPSFSIETRLIEEKVVLRVSDNGMGIESEALSKIFDPFFTTKSPGKGTGLGLYIVQQIIKNHFGEINVETKQGKGTTFKMVFAFASKNNSLPIRSVA